MESSCWQVNQYTVDMEILPPSVLLASSSADDSLNQMMPGTKAMPLQLTTLLTKAVSMILVSTILISAILASTILASTATLAMSLT
jgi:hypothetical protein